MQKKAKMSLPIEDHKHEILNLISNNQVSIICGETGSGKTTILPIILRDHYSSNPAFKIAVTQPRRLAAISVANRVAESLSTRVGNEVGYSVRFDESYSPQTKIKFLTDGKLLREVIQCPNLQDYSLVIVDEAHERSLNTDILLSLLLDVCSLRPDFKLVISSATLDTSKFSVFFNAPVYNVPGRLFPVTTYYTEEAAELSEMAIQTVLQIHESQPLDGDILVFLPGREEIESVENGLQSFQELNSKLSEMILLPVYASMNTTEQQRIFSKTPEKSRKVVLATNIAETSLTIPGIRYVVDSGLVKEKKFDGRLGTDSLTTVHCSQASANQRQGRAGRVSSGWCYRLYSKSTFEEMPRHTAPEILRSNLSSVMLFLLTLGSNPLNFKFIDSPSKSTLDTALEDLYALGAVNQMAQLTKEGRLLAEYPYDPKLGKSLLFSIKNGCLEDVAAVVAMIENFQLAKDSHFANPKGDHYTLLAIFTEFKQNKSKYWCRRHNFDFASLSAALRSYDQIFSISRRIKNLILDGASGPEKINDNGSKLENAFVSGFFLNSAERVHESYMLHRHRTRAYIHPTSVLKEPTCVIFTEILRTKREFMRICLSTDIETIRKLVPHYYKDKIDR